MDHKVADIHYHSATTVQNKREEEAAAASVLSVPDVAVLPDLESARQILVFLYRLPLPIKVTPHLLD